MANANVNITVTANSQQAQANLGSFSNKFTEIYSQMMLVKQGAEIVGGVFKTAFDLAKQGAQVELLRSRLENLTASIGVTSEALMGDLRAATRGLVSDAELMQNAADIISLGLADTGQGVVDLAKLISALGWDMQTVILTFANNSKMRLDALGLSVTDVEGRMAALETQGYSTDQAFDMAVIEAGKAKLELLGEAADTSAGSWQRLQAEMDNAKMILQEFLAQGLTPYIDISHDSIDIMDRQVDAAYSQNLSWDEMLETLGPLKIAMEGVNLVTLGAAKAKYEDKNAAYQNAQEVTRLMNATMGASEATQEWAENTFYAEQAISMQADSTYEAYVTSEKFADRLQLVNDKAIQLGEAMREAGPPVEELMDTLKQDISSPLKTFIDDLQFFIASGGQDFTGAFEAIKNALASQQITAGEAQEFSGELLASIENVKIAAGEITFDEAAANLSETLNVPLEDAVRLLGEVGTAADVVFGLNREISLDTSGVESAYNILLGMEDAVRMIEGSHDVTINVTTNGSVPSFTGPGGGQGQGQGGTSATGFASGADFIVPPGFPNDSYGPLYVQSGEHVQVTPAGQTSSGGVSNGNTIVQVFLDGAQIAARVNTYAGQNARRAKNSGVNRP